MSNQRIYSTQQFQLNQIDGAIRILKIRHQAIMHSLCLDLSCRNLNQKEVTNQSQSNPFQPVGYPFLPICPLWSDIAGSMIQKDLNVKINCTHYGLETNLLSFHSGLSLSAEKSKPNIVEPKSQEFMNLKAAVSESTNCSLSIKQGNKRAQPCGVGTISSQSRIAKKTRREN